jgi:hypothetical protein
LDRVWTRVAFSFLTASDLERNLSGWTLSRKAHRSRDM